MREIYYFYPKFNKGSFHFIAEQHINQLKNYSIVQDLDLYILDVMQYPNRKSMLLHPVFYPICGPPTKPKKNWKQILLKIRKTADHLGGIDTADSDRISQQAVYITNKFDLIIVPSTFARNVYRNSGVTAPLEILPHGLPKEFQENSRKIESDKVKPLLEFKKQNKAIYILFFLMHSGYRKGADLLAQAVKPLLEEYENLYLIVKRMYLIDPYMKELRHPKTIEVSDFFTWSELRELYDVADIIVVPSRGGGFELNALEGIARGLPTLVPDAGCFKDYIDYTIPVKVKRSVRVLPGNPIHVGYGWEVDVEDLKTQLVKTIENLDKLKRKFNFYAKKIRTKYSWEKIGIKLHQILVKHDFYK